MAVRAALPPAVQAARAVSAGARETGSLDSLAAALGHDFADPGLLREALTHPSAAVPGPSYERLEFLGDRVLGLAVADLLMARFGAESEGDLARRLAALVTREPLVEVARAVGLGRFIRLAKAEEDTGGRENPAILADCCEAVIGALYLDGGFEAARGFIARHWEGLIAADLTPPQDAKTALQEWAQGRKKPLPQYRTVAAEGPAHEPLFRVEVSVEGHPPVTAQGPTKRAAERAAAQELLHRLGEDAG